MQGKPLIGFDVAEAQSWASKIQWKGLAIMNTYYDGPEKGFVEFKADFIEGGGLKNIHEISEFHLVDGRWYYVDGQIQESPIVSSTKVGRNNPCPCGSGKKYKKCHGVN
jgi:SEC-C motif domain protein